MKFKRVLSGLVSLGLLASFSTPVIALPQITTDQNISATSNTPPVYAQNVDFDNLYIYSGGGGGGGSSGGYVNSGTADISPGGGGGGGGVFISDNNSINYKFGGGEGGAGGANNGSYIAIQTFGAKGLLGGGRGGGVRAGGDGNINDNNGRHGGVSGNALNNTSVSATSVTDDSITDVRYAQYFTITPQDNANGKDFDGDKGGNGGKGRSVIFDSKKSNTIFEFDSLNLISGENGSDANGDDPVNNGEGGKAGDIIMAFDGINAKEINLYNGVFSGGLNDLPTNSEFGITDTSPQTYTNGTGDMKFFAQTYYVEHGHKLNIYSDPSEDTLDIKINSFYFDLTNAVSNKAMLTSNITLDFDDLSDLNYYLTADNTTSNTFAEDDEFILIGGITNNGNATSGILGTADFELDGETINFAIIHKDSKLIAKVIPDNHIFIEEGEDFDLGGGTTIKFENLPGNTIVRLLLPDTSPFDQDEFDRFESLFENMGESLGKELILVYEITLMGTDGDVYPNSNYPLTAPGVKITITNNNLKNRDNLIVLHEYPHGTLEVLNRTHTSDTVVFHARSFSLFGIAANPLNNTPINNSGNDSGNTSGGNLDSIPRPQPQNLTDTTPVEYIEEDVSANANVTADVTPIDIPSNANNIRYDFNALVPENKPKIKRKDKNAE